MLSILKVWIILSFRKENVYSQVTGTVPANKNWPTGTVPLNENCISGTDLWIKATPQVQYTDHWAVVIKESKCFIAWLICLLFIDEELKALYNIA